MILIFCITALFLLFPTSITTSNKNSEKSFIFKVFSPSSVYDFLNLIEIS